MSSVFFCSLSCCFVVLMIPLASLKKTGKPEWAKKDVRDYSDVDVERLLDQWEEDEEPLPDDELPEYMRKPPGIDISKLDASNPEQLLKMTKKGQTLMAFVSTDTGDRAETDKITQLWHGSLWNNNIQCDRFLVDDHRAIFMFKDGSQAWEAKDFLISQDKCKDVTIENKVYDGKAKPKTKTKVKEEL